MERIEDILKEKLTWKDETESSDIFIADQYSKEVCYLRMNDFPDEPLWTLHYQGQSVDFNDAPKQWKIVYRSEQKSIEVWSVPILCTEVTQYFANDQYHRKGLLLSEVMTDGDGNK